MISRFGILLIAACAVAASTAASAQDAAIKHISAKRVDSECIGDVSSPLCAIDTWLACRGLGKPKLCALLGVEGMRFSPDENSVSDPYEIHYRVISIAPIAPDQIGLKLEGGIYLRPGYMVVSTMERFGNAKTIMGDGFEPFVYYLNKVGNAWTLAAWTNNISVTCEYPKTENVACKLYFWGKKPLGFTIRRSTKSTGEARLTRPHGTGGQRPGQ